MADYTTDPCHLYRDHADIRREVQTGFGETRYNIAERAGDIRREGAEHTNEIVKEGLKSECTLRGDIKDARFDVADRVGNSADRIVDRIVEHDAKVAARFFDVGRDTQDIRAQIIAQQQQMVAGFLAVSKDTELASLKTQLDSKQNTQYLNDKITSDGEKTRALINELKNADYNRMLIERNAEIVEHRHYGHHWRGAWDQSQWQNLTQQLANQTANFNSQLSEARQGMVNFGSMAGNAGQQTSTNNNVR
jgi:hypothetical protein